MVLQFMIIMEKINLIILLPIILLVGTIYFSKSPGELNTAIQLRPPEQPQQLVPVDWLEYQNTVRQFSLHVPPELVMKEYDEGDGTYTIVFEETLPQSSTLRKSFQIFFTPYLGDTITQSRILKDVPTGKFTTPIEVVIGGNVHALVFSSTGLLGEMSEAWFVHNGYLYEVTTYAQLDAWLAQILSTWRFD